MKFEINITKKHFWAIIAVIVILFAVVIVIATTPGWDDNMPFHEPLYTDTITGKSAVGGVTVDDDMEVTGDITADQSITLGGVSKDEWPDEMLKCLSMGGVFVEDIAPGNTVCEDISADMCTSVPNCELENLQAWVPLPYWYDACKWTCKYTG